MRRAVLLTIAAALAAAVVSCDGNDGNGVLDEPRLDSVSPGVVSVGDTVVLAGVDFGEDWRETRVAFSACGFDDATAVRYAVPFSGSTTELRCLVPDGVFSGGVRVEDGDWRRGIGVVNVVPAPHPSNVLPVEVVMLAGDVAKIPFGDAEHDITLATGESPEDYLLVLFNSAVPPFRSYTYLYRIEAGTYPVDAGEGGAVAERDPAGDGSRLFAQLGEEERRVLGAEGPRPSLLDRRLREETKRILDGVVAPEAPAPRFSAIAGPGPAPQTATFRVLENPDGYLTDPSNFTDVTADLKYEGAHTLLYVDSETYAAAISDAEAEALGLAFDGSIYGIDRNLLGEESDINGDGKVAILLSPVVNRMTPAGAATSEGFIAGFFMPGDLIPQYMPAGCTNGMEIFYTIVPDPENRYGNEYSKEYALDVIEGVLAHEFNHMIVFNYRVLIYGHGYMGTYLEELWLEEGLSHIAEDLNGYDRSNVLRANIFLADPGNTTLIHGGDALDERGAAYLFLRLLGDLHGQEIFRSLVQSRLSGTANVEETTGENFLELFADWSAACYLSGLGITDDPRFNYVSIDLPGDFGDLRVRETDFTATSIQGDVRSMAPEFILMHLGAGSGYTLSISGAAEGKTNAVLVRLE
ncbi:MAG: IPT/TIG domain-containing protein [Candidatus Krumholzibacteriota bacterium]|nr:IPT/TIG domain-containing protein [Candidatus Krumholzibacteriota bacterium]